MATANHITDTAEAPRDHRSRYFSMSPERRVEAALEMAEAISNRKERLYAVATALVSQLTPSVGDDPFDNVALRLAEVLEDMLTDHSQHFRLTDCLEVMQSNLQKAAAEVRHE